MGGGQPYQRGSLGGEPVITKLVPLLPDFQSPLQCPRTSSLPPPLRSLPHSFRVGVLTLLRAVLSRSVVFEFASPWIVARQAPLSMGILRAGILEWVTMSSSRGSSQPRDQTQVSRLAGGFFAI